MKKKVYLTLENGTVFQGYSFGASGESTGELVFSTGMVGYVESITDPCNYKKILVQTFPLIGNYGVNYADVESDKAWVSAYIVREKCDYPSNFRMQTDLDNFLKEKNVIGVYGIDTRQLTKILREEGSMKARISYKPCQDVTEIKNDSVENAVDVISPKTTQIFGDKNAKYHIGLINYGTKNSIIQNLTAENCYVTSMPVNVTVEEILSQNFDGVVLGDGAGNPAVLTNEIEQVKGLLGKLPIMGLGFGYQILALALGGKVKKQKYGHRGSNQPVKEVEGKRVYVSTQNHDYEVIADGMQGKVTYVNVNDGSCEGIDCKQLQAFGVQFMPECCIHGNETNPIYTQFFTMMKKENENA